MTSRTIGDPLAFAAQYELDADSGGRWMYGRFCYWCGGRQVGNFQTTTLRDVLFALENTIKWVVADRRSARFRELPAREVFRLLDGALYRGDLEPHWEDIAEQETWANYDIAPRANPFDDWRVFAIDLDLTTRVIWAREPFHDIQIGDVKAGQVARVLKQACEELAALYDATRGRADQEQS